MNARTAFRAALEQLSFKSEPRALRLALRAARREPVADLGDAVALAPPVRLDAPKAAAPYIHNSPEGP
jgi:hypothetical protein